MSPLRNVETKISGLVDRVFGRLFRGHVELVELARKLAREMEDHKTVSVSRVYVPNEYVIYLSRSDRERFSSFERSATKELGDYLTERARHEGFTLLSAPDVRMETDTDLRIGEYGIACRVVDPPQSEQQEERERPAEDERPRPRDVPFAPYQASSDVFDRHVRSPEPPVAAVPAPATPEPAEPPVAGDAPDAEAQEPAPPVVEPDAQEPAAQDAPSEEPPVDEPAAEPVVAEEAHEAPAAEAETPADEPDEAPADAAQAEQAPAPEPVVPVVPPPPTPTPQDIPEPPAHEPQRPAASAPLPPPGGYEPLAGVSGTQMMPPARSGDDDFVQEEVSLIIDGRRHRLTKRTTTIGRSRDCDITVNDPNASRHHAEVRHIGLDYFLVDQGSTNGSYVNGQRVRRHAIADGDRLVIGTTEIVVEHIQVRRP